MVVLVPYDAEPLLAGVRLRAMIVRTSERIVKKRSGQSAIYTNLTVEMEESVMSQDESRMMNRDSCQERRREIRKEGRKRKNKTYRSRESSIASSNP